MFLQTFSDHMPQTHVFFYKASSDADGKLSISKQRGSILSYSCGSISLFRILDRIS